MSQLELFTLATSLDPTNPRRIVLDVRVRFDAATLARVEREIDALLGVQEIDLAAWVDRRAAA